MPRASRINSVVRAYQNRSLPVSAELLVNMYVEPTSNTSKSPNVLHGTSGKKLFANVGDGPIWGMHRFGNYIYLVSGNEVYILDSAGGSTLLGQINSIDAPVQIFDNGVTAIILDNATGSTYLATPTSLTQVTDPDFRVASSGTFLDGYAIFSEKDSDIWFISELRDASQYRSIDFTRAEADSDIIVRVFATFRELWVFGQRSIEIYYNTGNPSFPFEQQQGANLQQGCGATLSVAQIKNSILWLGEDGTVQLARGYAPQKVSIFAIDEEIRKLERIDNAFAFTYTEEGHDFYCITFPDQFTLEYDISVNEWHKRKAFERPIWGINAHAAFDAKNLVGDDQNGIVYELDLDQFTDNGEEIERIIQTPPLFADKNRIFLDRFQIDFEAGTADLIGQGSDPVVMLQRSDDGGRTFSNELFATIGKRGEFKDETVYRRLGSASNMTYRIKITDPIKVSIAGILAIVRVGEI